MKPPRPTAPPTGLHTVIVRRRDDGTVYVSVYGTGGDADNWEVEAALLLLDAIDKLEED
jgi:hypothetical protein